jgi:hypothetical protein
MKTDSTILEILLFTTTSFSQRQLCETDARDRDNNLAPAEQLEAACWNGLLHEMLPEVLYAPNSHEKLFLWQVDMRENYLRISMAACPPVLEEYFTLDPHIFLQTKRMN